LNIFNILFNSSFNLSSSFSSIKITASASRGMALFLAPPLIWTKSRLIFAWFNKWFKILPISIFEFALCLFISIPEWPPSNPFTSILKATFEFTSLNSFSIVTKAVTPPAQLTVIVPSSSESKFIM